MHVCMYASGPPMCVFDYAYIVTYMPNACLDRLGSQQYDPAFQSLNNKSIVEIIWSYVQYNLMCFLL